MHPIFSSFMLMTLIPIVFLLFLIFLAVFSHWIFNLIVIIYRKIKRKSI